MVPFLLVAIPLSLIVLGMILNSIPLGFDQPRASPEQDPVKRLAAERESYRLFFDRQRSLAMKRQKRVGQYAWLLMIATAAAFIWLYIDTAGKTAAARRIVALQTLAAQESPDIVLSLTSIDGSNFKYRVKAPASKPIVPPSAAGPETVSSWELDKLATAASMGEIGLPLGVALQIDNR